MTVNKIISERGKAAIIQYAGIQTAKLLCDWHSLCIFMVQVCILGLSYLSSMPIICTFLLRTKTLGIN